MRTIIFIQQLIILFLLPSICFELIDGEDLNTTLPQILTESPPQIQNSPNLENFIKIYENENFSSSTTISPSSLILPQTTTISSKILHLLDSIHPNNLRHHHHAWGPHFEENLVNLTVREGDKSILDCKVGLIEDKLVTWFRRKSDRLDLLTLGIKTHSSDPRISADFKYPNNWRLVIKSTSRNDSGIYICQISTHPPKVLEVQLNVDAPDVFIVNSRNEKIQDVHYKEGSTLVLQCSVNNIKSRVVNWFRNEDLLNQDISRGGISIKTEINKENAKSTLRVALVSRKDSGLYICSAPPHKVNVSVHILQAGENPAELYHNDGLHSKISGQNYIFLFVFIFLYYNYIPYYYYCFVI